MASEASLGTLFCRSSALRAMSRRPSARFRPKGGGPEGWGPNPRKGEGGAQRVRGPKFRAVFTLPPNFSLFFYPLGVFSWTCGRGPRPWTTQSVRLGFSGVILCEPRRPAGRRPPLPRILLQEGHLPFLGQGGGELEPLFGCSAQGLDSCSIRWRSGFPRIAGPLVLTSGCWVHDGFQMLSGLSDAPTLTTRCRCQAASEHFTNIAHLVSTDTPAARHIGTCTVTPQITQNR